MDVPPTPPAQVSPPPKRRNRLTVWLTIVFGVLLLAIVVLVSVSFLPDPKIVWLTPTDLNQPRQSTFLTRLKFNVARVVWPVIGRFWPRKSSIRIDGSFLALSPAANQQTGLGVPFATNADGLRVWILSSVELTTFQKRLVDLPGVSFLGKPRIQTASGIQAAMSVGGPTNSFAVDLLPTSISDSIKLTISVTATERTSSTPRGLSLMKTNLAAACRVLVPNSGGVIIDGGPARDDSGNTWWFIASPVKVDAKGNPIKP